jgi:hypothetical protein
MVLHPRSSIRAYGINTDVRTHHQHRRIGVDGPSVSMVLRWSFIRGPPFAHTAVLHSHIRHRHRRAYSRAQQPRRQRTCTVCRETVNVRARTHTSIHVRARTHTTMHVRARTHTTMHASAPDARMRRRHLPSLRESARARMKCTCEMTPCRCATPTPPAGPSLPANRRARLHRHVLRSSAPSAFVHDRIH